jgi:hypothetical protein
MLTALALSTLLADASSHREAPAIALDPAADLTDVYAFVSPIDSTKIELIMNVNPLQDPGGGPNYHFFDDSVSYRFNIDNEGDGIADVQFIFSFTTTYQHPDEFLYNLGDITNAANLNRVQTYTLTRIDDGVQTQILKGAAPGIVAPTNVGTQSDPTGGYDPYSLTGGALTASYSKAKMGYKVFAGPRQEGFYVDLGRTFDLLNVAGIDPGANHNSLLGTNVSTIALEVPASTLTKDGLAPTAGSNEVIAVWATTMRKQRLTRSTISADLDVDSGAWVQVSRLGSPLVNEVVIPVGDKDAFNASQPTGDLQFLSYVTDPILMGYLTAVLGVPDPGCYNAGLGVGCREDLVQVFLTGHPALGTQPAGYALGGPIPGENKTFGAFEALRLNMAVAGSSYPNGRNVGDDVVDVSLSAVAGLLINGTFLPDGVSSTGITYLSQFPWLGDPWAGDNHPANVHDF